MRVRELMTPPKTLRSDALASDASEVLERWGVPRAVVVDPHRRVVAIVSADDLSKLGPDETLRGLAISPPPTVGEDESVADAANRMRSRELTALAVLADGGTVSGIVTAFDLLELVGSRGHPERRTLRDHGPGRGERHRRTPQP